jgi:deoxyribodipyrimidine photolyase-related protein
VSIPTQAVFIFPHQLFKRSEMLDKDKKHFLIEEHLFFTQYPFHKEKLVLHRASMKAYEQYLLQEGYQVQYIESTDTLHDCRILIDHLAKEKYAVIYMVDPVDYLLMRRIKKACASNNIALQVSDSPGFLNTLTDTQDYFASKKKYFQTDFYTAQRKQRKLLLTADGKPEGGKWTFDAENRAKFPKKEIIPELPVSAANDFVSEAEQYVQKNFPNNYGAIGKHHLFAIDFIGSEKWLETFLSERFEKFGIYEDAIVQKESVLYHSVLSPMLNIGLLTPQEIIDAAIRVGTSNNIPLNSLEGFIRQIVGWREFIRLVYEREGTKQRTTNYWQFKRKIPKTFWTGDTGIAPIDITIKKILKTGYAHHIERLMVLGNFMLLCEFDPDEVHKWFMEMFIDAYDWVMVPNVYGMTQFADGGLMTTKPYISGSNYLSKMSDYEKGTWQPIWDGLFWRFMHVHRDFFLQNPRIGMLVKTFDKMSDEKRNTHIQAADNYLQSLDKQ